MSAQAAAKPSPKQTFTQLLDSLLQGSEGDSVTLGGLLKLVGRRSFGPIILLLGFIWISPLTIVPGANWLVAAITILFALQMMVGMRHPWLPKGLLNRSFPRSALEGAVKMARMPAHVADKLTAPRLAFLTEPPFIVLPALACIAASVVTFPLGLIPFGPVLPGLSVVLLGVAVTARDGISLLLALVALFGAGLLLLRGLQWLM